MSTAISPIALRLCATTPAGMIPVIPSHSELSLAKVSLRGSLQFMRGNMLVLTATGVLGMFARSMAFPYNSLFILALGGSPERIGLVNSLAPLAGLIAFPLAGYISDHAGRVKLIALAGLFSGLVRLIYVLAPSWEWLALSTLLLGFGVLQFPPSSAIIADSLAPEDRGRGVATMNVLCGVPAILAPYLAGALLERMDIEAGMRVLYGVLTVAYIVGAGINAKFLRETTKTAPTGLHWRELPSILTEAYRGIPETLRGLPRSLRGQAAVLMLGLLSNAIAGPFWVVYAVEHIGLSAGQWGLILLIETALRNAASLPCGYIVDKRSRAFCMRVGQVLSLIGIPLFVLATGFWSVLATRALIALANGIFLPASSALMADLVPRETRGRVMAALGRGTVMLGVSSGGTGGPGVGFLATIPLMIASFSAGYLYNLGPQIPWAFALAATVVSLAISLRYVRDPKRVHV